MTITARSVLVLTCMLFVISAAAFSVPRDWDGQPNHVDDDKTSRPEVNLAEVGNYSSNQAKSGDTVVIFCDDQRYALGSFGGSDVWGWTAPDGRDYAMMGTNFGLVFVNVSDTEVVDTVIGPAQGCSSSYWRDIKTYQHYCYCVSECVGTNEGMMVIDMQYLPDSVHLINSFFIYPGGIPYSHNMSIDTVKGFAYAEAYSSEGFSIVIWDLADPTNPQFVNSFGIGGSGGIHDVYANNDTVFVAEGGNGTFSIYNLANKNAPQLLARVAIPFAGYVHNVWPGKNGQYCATTEETPGKTVKIWDISNLSNIQLVGQWLGASGLAHNAHFQGDTVYVSHYQSGVSIVDVTNPALPVEVASYDTYPSADNADFDGCWGVFPHTPDGRIYASNMDGHLFVLSEQTVVLADTLYGETVAGQAGTQVRVDVNARNTLAIHKFIIPFTWAGPLNMNFDSASTVGLRTEYFEVKSLVGFDPFNSRAAYSLTSTTGTTTPDLPPGDGPILSLYFTIPSGTGSGLNSVQFKPYSSFQLSFVQSCLPYEPDTVSATVLSGGATCCIGIRGNVNGDGTESIDIADLTYLVAYMFKGAAAPPCLDEANVNASGQIDVADLTFLTNFMFKSGPSPASCP